MNVNPIYACFFGDGEITGFTVKSETACNWASQVAGNNKSVRIVKIYEIQCDHESTASNGLRHNCTPDVLAQQENPLKPLTLADLKQQVDMWYASNYAWSNPFPEKYVLLIGDFEIRRRK
jgi:hypothetical protein